jgi:hypothetical protein
LQNERTAKPRASVTWDAINHPRGLRGLNAAQRLLANIIAAPPAAITYPARYKLFEASIGTITTITDATMKFINSDWESRRLVPSLDRTNFLVDASDTSEERENIGLSLLT